MRRRTLAVTALVFVAGFPALVWGGECERSDDVGTRCTLPVEDLRPTQFSVGSVAVDCKAAQLTKKAEDDKLKKYLKNKKRRVPVVVGPEGDFFLTDRHHLVTALERAEVKKKDKLLHVEILESYDDRDLSWGAFWQEMQQQNFTYNADNKGTPNMSFALLPEEVDGLLNDPYRTLSRWVRESCGYIKEGKEQCEGIRPDPPPKAPFFMEFYWADFFRDELPMQTANLAVCKSIPYASVCVKDEVEQLKGLYREAMKLSASNKAWDYFESLRLNSWDYGYNPSGRHLEVTWGGKNDACEEVEEP